MNYFLVSSETSSHRAATVQRGRTTSLLARAFLPALVSLLLLALHTTAHAATVPQGFTETQVAGGLSNPVAMEFAPDGRLFVSEQAGRVLVVKDGVLLSTPFVDLTNEVDASGERGVAGIAFDPNFSSNHYVYIYYTAISPASHNRVSRFTASGDVAVAGSEVVIIDLTTLGASLYHNGGAIHFGGDGKLYIGTGDANVSDNADSFGNLLGKILRINSDGSIPTDNPFYNSASGINRAIWALGLRNPYTFAVQPGTGRIFINDVGENTWEEINDGIAGSHYGWPSTEGPTDNPAYRSPIFAYQHGSSDTTGCAITGGIFYNPQVQQFPTSYNGSYFFGDYCSGWIRRLDTTANNAVTSFVSGISSPVDLKVGPADGALYYLARGSSGQSGDFRSNTGFINKITYTANQSPAPATDIYLSDLSWVDATNGWGLVERDQSNGEDGGFDGHTITLNGVTYSKGLGVHAPSQIIYALSGNYSNFIADVGVDDEVGANGSVTFEVWADGVKLYDSGVMTGASNTQSVNVNITGRQQLVLIVTDAGDGKTADHADWAGARITKVTGGVPPTITQQPASQSVSISQAVTFTVAATGTTPLSYQWQRNGANIAGATSQSYTISSASAADNGARFRCVVSNASGSATSNEALLTVGNNQPPVPTIVTPQAGSLYSAGETISFSGAGADAEDGQLPASAFTWEVVFHHDTHTHPFINPFSGVKSGTFQIPDVGETSTNVWYRIYLTVKDSSGATSTVFRDILPRKVNLLFSASPEVMQFTLDGQPRTTPFTVESVVGMKRAVAAVTPQLQTGVTYNFTRWTDSNDGAARVITTPTVTSGYTMIFSPQATPTPTPQPVTFTDDFNDNARDSSRWSVGIMSKPSSYFDSQVVVAERNQRLEIVPRPALSGNHYAGYVTAGFWDMTGGSATVEVVQATNSGANTIFAVGLDPNNSYRFVVEDGRLYFQKTSEPFSVTNSVVYSPSAHRFWRLRHDSGSEQIIFETSSDGAKWNVMRSMQRDMTLAGVRVELSAGTFTPITSPGTAIFDNFKFQGINTSPTTSTAVGFAASEFFTSEAAREVTLTVNRAGDATTAFTVDYSTFDNAGLTPCDINSSGAASERCDYATTAGTLRFAAGEMTKTIRISIVDDFYVEDVERFYISLRNPQGANLNLISTATILIGGSGTIINGAGSNDSNDRVNPPNNPTDFPDTFITLQYIDFLGRQPDSTGFQNWLGTLSPCPEGGYGLQNPQCDRVHVAQSFYQSEEFQTRGYWAYRFYEVAFGRRPSYSEFIPDMAQVGGPKSPEDELISKQQFIDSFVKRAEFTQRYANIADPAQYVDALLQTAGLPNLSDRSTIIGLLQSGQISRAQALKQIVESKEVEDKFYNRGFVSMMYFGFLRRDPDATGFNNYLLKLQSSGDPRPMVFDFIYSTEYRGRFGKP